MTSQISWMIILTVSVCAIILSAALGEPIILMFMTGAVSLGLALVAIRAHRHLEADGASRGVLSATIARHMGLIWAWGCLGLLICYGLLLPKTWHEWPVFFGGFAAAAVACLVYASALARDEQLGRKDDAMINLGRYLTIAQLLGMLATLIGICIDPDKRLLSDVRPDWVANNIFVAGAVALTAVSAYALMRDRASKA
jgi:hypothetical protein